MPLRVGIIVDWSRSARGSHWEALLQELDTTGLLPNVRRQYPLADLIVAPPGAADKFLTHGLDVLIVNWDAANGDPAFGAHLAQRWLDHRRPELLLWVRDGNLLIIEGQAVLSVPSQQTYDALLGRNEMRVCGAEDPLNPIEQKKRMGGRCRKTRHLPREKGFENVPAAMTVGGHPTHELLFPGVAASLLTAHISNTNWSNVLYRGGQRSHASDDGSWPVCALPAGGCRRRRCHTRCGGLDCRGFRKNRHPCE